MQFSDWIAGARPRTLPAAVVPVAVGAGAALGVPGVSISWWRVALALAVSLLLQIGVNYANDYSDGVRGTDDVRVGPIRLVASGRATPGSVKRAALAALGLAAVCGLVLAAATTWWLLAVGVAALASAWGYTGGPKPYGYLGLGELFVFTFFGLVATAGSTYVALAGRLPAGGRVVPGVTWPAACGVGCLACALLVINNLRDIPTDRVAGKRTLAVRIGDHAARRLYLALVAGAFVLAAACAVDRPWALVALAGVVPAIAPARNVMAGAAGPALIPVLGATGKVQVGYGVLLAVGFAVG